MYQLEYKMNPIKIVEWDLTLSQSYVFAWMYQLQSWGEPFRVEEKIYYYASRNLAVEHLSFVTANKKTMTTHYRKLHDLGLIEYITIRTKDYVSITSKGKTWNLSLDNILNTLLTLAKKNASGDQNALDYIYSKYSIFKPPIAHTRTHAPARDEQPKRELSKWETFVEDNLAGKKHKEVLMKFNARQIAKVRALGMFKINLLVEWLNWRQGSKHKACNTPQAVMNVLGALKPLSEADAKLLIKGCTRNEYRGVKVMFLEGLKREKLAIDSYSPEASTGILAEPIPQHLLDLREKFKNS